MIDLYSVPDQQLKQTTRFIKHELARRGWKAELPFIGTSMVEVQRPDGVKLSIYSSTPPTTSFVAARAADDKLTSHFLFETVPGVRTLQTNSIRYDNHTAIQEFVDRFEQIVIKPIDGSHGNGVTTQISTFAKATVAINEALKYTKRTNLIFQQQYPHAKSHEVRILCINGKFEGAIYRQPARVYGDGEHTIRYLIEQENRSELRGIAYIQPLATMPMASAEEFLGNAIDTIPQKGEEVAVLGVANYGMGGETIDVTDSIPLWLQEQAIAIAERVGIVVAGVDVIMAAYPTESSTVEELDAMILEVNKGPSLAIHVMPTSGKPRPVIEAYIDYLESL